MGCICGKTSAIEDIRESPKERQLNKGSSELRVPRGTSSRREESFRVKQRPGTGDVRVGLVDKKVNGSRRVRDEHSEKKRENSEVVIANHPGMGSVPKAIEGEQVAAGWPSWLAVVAGEAIKGWLPRRADAFEKLDKIGQGTYSSVYKARDLIHKKVVALKRVRFDNLDPESVKFMAREIIVLRRLDHPNIIKLEGLVTSRTSCSLYLVFEYMEHDLTGLASIPGIKFTEPQIKCYMQQLLSGLDHCHSRGVLHRDIKGLMETLLSIDPAHRGTAACALKSEFFTTKPFSCEPSSLPKYPPSKEIDAKLRDEEARRQGAAAGARDQETRGPKEPRSIPASGANAELVESMKRRQGYSNRQSHSELFNFHQEEAASGFPIDRPRQSQAVKAVGKDLPDHIPKRATHSGPLVPGVGWTKAGKKYDDISIVSTRADLSTLSGLVASRTVLTEEGQDKLASSRPETTNLVSRLSESYEELEPTRKEDRKRHTHSNAGSHLMENGRASTKPIVNGYGTKGNKIHFSGPLLVPSDNVDQMLKEHDRQIQEAARRARHEKRLGKVQAQVMQIAGNPIHVSSRRAG
ncbi:hypothetical protein F0562_010825 [Nyssa sinensis]|uniref:Protein kinase domain-containing protein n=1 Tax=Nyssa sinensis TaxID=561372 RepID=A0A5J5A2F9_9ASTE|nr:hypothetical protein F0562_010825 [Nyssa sinensis]